MNFEQVEAKWNEVLQEKFAQELRNSDRHDPPRSPDRFCEDIDRTIFTDHTIFIEFFDFQMDDKIEQICIEWVDFKYDAWIKKAPNMLIDHYS